MPIYIKWLLFILLFAFLFSIFLWFRTRKVSRFQGRLALFFFLFVIIPLTPLTLFLGQVVIKSTETFMIPGVEQSLMQSLDVIRSQLNDRGHRFLNTFSSFDKISHTDLEAAGMLYAGKYVAQDSVFMLEHFIGQQSSPGDAAMHQTLALREMDQLLQQGQLSADPNVDIFESFRRIDSSVLVVGCRVPETVIDAKNSLTTSLRNYATLGLLRETMVQENVFWFVIFIVLLFIAVISVLLARLVSSGMSGPIRKLTDGMRRIGAGDLEHRVNVKAKDEIAYLIESFNRMAEELKVSREKLQRAERAAAWRDIARQVSHEIKNPLTPIDLSIYRLQSCLPHDYSENYDVTESLRIIREEISSIRRIADTFSQFAKMPHAELTYTDISKVVKASVDLYRNDSSGVTIEFAADSDLPPVEIDQQQIRSVMNNLIKNAIEASREGDEVSVTVMRNESRDYRVTIQIRDHGCGMDEETQRRIFDPYFTTKAQGSGIGLFLVKRIITDHGGQIDVSSSPGKGTVFSIFL